MLKFEIALPARFPRWLSGNWGGRLLGTIGKFMDAAQLASGGAVRARYARKAPADALPDIGDDSSIERVPGETDVSFRQRLFDRWDTWQSGGTNTAIATALVPLGFGPNGVHVLGWKENYVRHGGLWPYTYFDIVVEASGHTESSSTWSDDGTWDEPETTWDSSLTPNEVLAIRRIVWKWKSAEGIPETFHVLFSGMVWDTPGDLWGTNDGVWGDDNVASISLANFWGDDGDWDDGGVWGGRPEGVN